MLISFLEKEVDKNSNKPEDKHRSLHPRPALTKCLVHCRQIWSQPVKKKVWLVQCVMPAGQSKTRIPYILYMRYTARMEPASQPGGWPKGQKRPPPHASVFSQSLRSPSGPTTRCAGVCQMRCGRPRWVAPYCPCPHRGRASPIKGRVFV